MKHLLSLLFACVISFSIMQAQVPPQAFNYSAVARNPLGQPIANSTIGIQINIIKSSTTGVSQYTENHFVNTDNFGLFNLVVGAGAVQSGSMSSIDWGSDDFYLRVGMDANGGTNFLTMGTTQLMSVPYALHAATADSIIGGVNTSGIVISSISNSGDTLFLSNGQVFVSGGSSTSGNFTLPTLTTSIDTTSTTGVIGGGNITNSNGNLIAERGVVLSASPNPTIYQSNKIAMGSGGGIFSNTLQGITYSGNTNYMRAYAITENNLCSYGNEIVFTSPLGSFIYDGFASGGIFAPLFGTDTSFTNLLVSSEFTFISGTSYNFAIDLSGILGAPSGTFVPNANGTLVGTTLTITNQTYIYQGIASMTIDGTVNFDSTFDNILNTSNLTFSGDVVGTITFNGVKQ